MALLTSASTVSAVSNAARFCGLLRSTLDRYLGLATRTAFAPVLYYSLQFTLADHRPGANFGPLQAPLAEPCVNRPLTDSAEPTGGLAI